MPKNVTKTKSDEKSIYELSITEDLVAILKQVVATDDHNAMFFFINTILNDVNKIKTAEKAKQIQLQNLISRTYGQNTGIQYDEYHPI